MQKIELMMSIHVTWIVDHFQMASHRNQNQNATLKRWVVSSIHISFWMYNSISWTEIRYPNCWMKTLTLEYMPVFQYDQIRYGTSFRPQVCERTANTRQTKLPATRYYYFSLSFFRQYKFILAWLWWDYIFI